MEEGIEECREEGIEEGREKGKEEADLKEECSQRVKDSLDALAHLQTEARRSGAVGAEAGGGRREAPHQTSVQLVANAGA